MPDDLHTIGEFARRTGLTEKALRLYDRRGLLRPAEVDPQSGYRLYSADQVDEGRVIAMLRAVGMPLRDIGEVLAADPADRSAAVGRYWYRVERTLDDHRETVRQLRGYSEAKEHGMSHSETAIAAGRDRGIFAAIASLAAIEDPAVAANAYGEAMKSAYWEHKDIPTVTAIAYAGTSRLLAAAEELEADAAYELRSAAKGLMYDLASFTWPGWDEPGVEIEPGDAAAGLAAARSNLAMAVELDKGDLPMARAHWMLGGHLLTAGDFEAARAAFSEAATFADRAGSDAESLLADAFRALTDLAEGREDGAGSLSGALSRLASAEGGEMFVAQVESARAVIGV